MPTTLPSRRPAPASPPARRPFTRDDLGPVIFLVLILLGVLAAVRAFAVAGV